MQKFTPRATSALSVVAVTFFLTVCVARYGAAAFANPAAANEANGLVLFTGWLVVTFGAGLWALLLLPMIWGAIVYFEEKTPDLVMRLVGTVVLAMSISTLAGLCGVGLWEGHIGHAIAGALGGLIGWPLTLALFCVSSIFATDWFFHTLRRASRAAAEAPRAVAPEPMTAELLVDAAVPAEREFVVETPRAAVAAAEMDEIVENSDDALEIPSGWDETEDEGRTVIAAPSGYRGVEFLPQSDELALPQARTVNIPALEQQEVADDQSVFSDEEFVTTEDAAFFVTHETAAEAFEEPVTAASPAEEDPVVADAVETLFEAVTEPAAEPTAAPASGIGLPDDSPFRDEFFGASEAGWPFAAEPAAAAPAPSEITPRFTMPAEPAPPVVVESEEAPAFIDEVFAPEAVVSRIPASAFDDSFPAEPAQPAERFLSSPAVPELDAETAVATVALPETATAVAVEPEAEALAETPAPAADEPVVAAEPEPVAPPEPVLISAPVAAADPQLTLFAETSVAESPSATAPAAAPELNLAVLHGVELDPLFRDAVNAILERGRASAVVLQRQLGIGYARGIRILDQMTMAGLTGPDTPTGTRELRVTREAWDAFTA